MSASTEAWVDERGILRVPLTPHTCHEFAGGANCAACDEAAEYWASFEAPGNPVPVAPLDWDLAADLSKDQEGLA